MNLDPCSDWTPIERFIEATILTRALRRLGLACWTPDLWASMCRRHAMREGGYQA